MLHHYKSPVSKRYWVFCYFELPSCSSISPLRYPYIELIIKIIAEIKQPSRSSFIVQNHIKYYDIYKHEELWIALQEKQMTELFTHFNDTIISSATSQGNLGNDDFMRPYIERINEYVLANQNNVVIHKNKTNQTLSNEDIDSLELILFDQIGTKEEYVQTFTILHLVD